MMHHPVRLAKGSSPASAVPLVSRNARGRAAFSSDMLSLDRVLRDVRAIADLMVHKPMPRLPCGRLGKFNRLRGPRFCCPRGRT